MYVMHKYLQAFPKMPDLNPTLIPRDLYLANFSSGFLFLLAMIVELNLLFLILILYSLFLCSLIFYQYTISNEG